MPYEITIPIGDWSKDGHEKCEEVTFISSHPVDALREAYLESIQKTGLTFDHDHEGVEICTEYEDRELSDEVQEKIKNLGFDIDNIDDPECLDSEVLSDIILWFIGLSLPDFQYEKQEQKKTYLNGFWNKKLNVQFGYGVV